jgi:hypothetical protein
MNKAQQLLNKDLGKTSIFDLPDIVQDAIYKSGLSASNVAEVNIGYAYEICYKPATSIDWAGLQKLMKVGKKAKFYSIKCRDNMLCLMFDK